jgi:hypothetical protein
LDFINAVRILWIKKMFPVYLENIYSEIYDNWYKMEQNINKNHLSSAILLGRKIGERITRTILKRKS